MSSRPKLSVADLRAPSKTLAELAQDAMALAQALMACEGELTPELEQQLDFNAEALARKVDAYVCREDHVKMFIEYWKRKEQGCAAIRKRFESFLERHRDRVKQVLGDMGKNEIAGAEYRYKLVQRKPKLVITDPEQIPAAMKMAVMTTVPDKDQIAKALEAGFEIPGATLEPVVALNVYENAEKE